MARSRLIDTASVPIVLRISVSEEDVAQIDEVLARPEFADWSRTEWCREIIRTALRYYMRAPAVPEARSAPAAPEARPSPAAPEAAPAPVRESTLPTPAPDPDPPLPAADEAVAEPPEPAGQSSCPHPQEARDYQSGTCAACGAILWD